VRFYLVGLSAIFLLASSFAFVDARWASIRNWQIILTLATIVYGFARNITGADLFLLKIPRSLRILFLASALLSMLVSTWSQYFSFHLNGIDFSIFDWMLYNTNHRQFMTSPVCECNHFGIHPSYVMLPLAPLHWLWPSPLMLQTVHAVMLWSGVFGVWRLAKLLWPHEVIAALASVAYLTNSWTGGLLNHGFHFEVFLLPFSMLFLVGWQQKKFWKWFLGLLLMLAAREDIAIYMLGFVAGILIGERKRWHDAVQMGIACVVFAFINLRIAQPYFLSLHGDLQQPHYLARFWGFYGNDPRSILVGMVSHPLAVIRDVVTSDWYLFFGSALLVPILSWQLFATFLPILIVYGTATGDWGMRQFAMHYAAPLIPFLFWGLLANLQLPYWRKRISYRIRLMWLAAGCVMLMLFGGGYQKFYAPNFAALAAVEKIKLDPQYLGRPVCVQTALFPHLPYEWDLRPLTAACKALPNAIVIADLSLDPMPMSKAELEALIN